MDNINLNALWLCKTLKRDVRYIQDLGYLQLLSGILTEFIDETLLPQLVSNLHTAETVSANRHSDISPETLSKKWHISLGTTRHTLKITTQ